MKSVLVHISEHIPILRMHVFEKLFYYDRYQKLIEFKLLSTYFIGKSFQMNFHYSPLVPSTDALSVDFFIMFYLGHGFCL